MTVEYLTVNYLSTEDLIRFFSKVSIIPSVTWNGTACWNWKASRGRKGYGVFWHGKHQKAHRFTFAWTIHPLPVGQALGEIDHLCANKSCCNPVHLEFVDGPENARRAAEARAGCKHGHLWTPENTGYRNGKRYCLTCANRPRYKKLTKEQRERANALQNARRDASKDAYNAQARAYNATRRDIINQRTRESRAANRSAYNAKAAKWRQANREKINARQRAARAANPEGYKATNKKHNDRRHK